MYDEPRVCRSSDRHPRGGPCAHATGKVHGVESLGAQAVGDGCRPSARAAHDDDGAVVGKVGETAVHLTHGQEH